LLDRSESGYRLAAPMDDGQLLSLGSVVALMLSTENWALGIVRRVQKISSTLAEYGVEVIGRNARVVNLRASHRVDAASCPEGEEAIASDSPMLAVVLAAGDRATDPQAHSIVLPRISFAPGSACRIEGEDFAALIRLKSALAAGSDWVWTDFDQIDLAQPLPTEQGSSTQAV